MFHYVALWLWLLLFSAACTSFGQLLLVRAFRLELRAPESAVLGMALGTVAFTLFMYAAGAAAMLTSGFAIALPVGMLLASGRDGANLLSRLARERTPMPVSAVSAIALAFGGSAIALTYVRTLTPDALGYDSAWYHLKIAQDYARWGQIGPFPGDYSHALPHLASFLYTWGYLLPGLHVAERWIFALHMEFCLLLWTLAGISVAVTRLVGPRAPQGSFAAFFLLPGIFLHNVWATSEHVVGLFAVPIALATVMFCASPGPKEGALFAALLGGGVLAKYQIIYLAVPALIAVTVAWGLGWARLRRFLDPAARRKQMQRLVYAPLVMGLVGAFVVFPHFLKNTIYYGNPVYPFLMDVFPSRPSVPDGALLLKHGLQPEAPSGSLFKRFAGSLKVLTTVPLLPRNVWPDGGFSLFVALAPAVIWLRNCRALRVFASLGLGALIVWGMVLPYTRYLEAFTPVLAAGLGALLVLLWRQGFIARLGLVPLVSLQTLWVLDGTFTDYSFFTVQASLDLIHKAVKSGSKGVFDSYRRGYREVGESLPKNAKVVLHTSGPSLGIDRDISMDSMGFQGLIDYRTMRTPRDVYDRFRALGFTHTIHEPHGYPSPTFQEDVLFHALVFRYGVDQRLIADTFYVAGLPSTPPPREAPWQVLCVNLPNYSSGLYPVEELQVWTELPPELRKVPKPIQLASPGEESRLLETADAVLCQACDKELVKTIKERDFERVPHRAGDSELFVKPAP